MQFSIVTALIKDVCLTVMELWHCPDQRYACNTDL